MRTLWARLRGRDIEDPLIAELIKPPRQMFTDQDDSLRVRTARRRAEAEVKRQAARDLDTQAGDDRRSRIHLAS